MFWTPRLCRICATVGVITYPIFATTDFESKFKKCLQINVYQDDFKPKDICLNCAEKLNDFCAFLDLCITSNNKFESILYQTNRSEVPDNWQSGYKISSDLFSPTENGVIVKPDDLILVTQYKNDILNIDRDVISTGNININEALEDFEQTQNQTVLRHSSEFYKDNIDCNLEEFSFSFRKKVPEENFETFNEPFSEKLVDYNEGVEVIPPPAAETTPNSIKESQKQKPFTCDKCNKSFMRKLTLQAHMSTHTNIKPYHCEVCDKSFPLRWALTCHKKIHSKLFQCKHCSKSFPAASKLERHVRIHTNERPFKCEFEGCGKTFSDKRNLVGHQVTHSKDRKFVCDICKKCYKTNSQLKDHKRAHTDVCFTCNVCNKSFKWKTNLIVHMKKHGDYSCKICKVDFKNKSVLLKHEECCEANE